MSVEMPKNLDEMIEQCFVLLGEPVIKVNVTREQARIKVRYGIKKFVEYHYEGTDKAWLKVPITDSIGINKQFKLPDYVIGVEKLMNYSTFGGMSQDPMISASWANMWTNLTRNAWGYGMNYGSNIKLDMYLYQREMSEWELMFNPVPNWSFNTVTKVMQIDGSQAKMPIGGFFMIRAFVDMAAVTDRFWQQPLLVNYCAALIREQWGTNLIKYVEMGLPGGNKVNGERILAKAEADIAKYEEEIMESGSYSQTFVTIG
jgi:hypothetical protein